MEQCKYCKKMFKQIVKHINRCPEKQEDIEIPGMTPCPYCQKMFKQLSGHLYRCPENAENKPKTPVKKMTKKTSSSGDEGTDLTPCPHCKKKFKRLTAHIYQCPENGENKPKTSARKITKKESSSEEEAPDLTPCPHCKKDFKRLAAHIYRCPEKVESKQETSARKISKKAPSLEDEVTDLTPCPHCKKDFKRLSAHIYRCPENAESKQKTSARKITKKAPLSEDGVADLTQCPHCEKYFKRLATHIYQCPENAENKPKTPARKITKKTSSPEDEVADLTPCPHCKRQFKLLAAHIYRCPENTDSKQETSRKMIQDKFSSEEDEATNLTPSQVFTSEEVEDDEEEDEEEEDDDEEEEEEEDEEEEEEDEEEAVTDMQPCPYCKKIFKKLEDHVSNCPEYYELNLEMPQKEITKNHSSSGNMDLEDFASKKTCLHCQTIFGISIIHIINCPNKMIKLEDVVDNTTNFNLSTDQRSSISASSLFYSLPSAQVPEFEKSNIREVTSQLTRPPIHVDYVSGPKQKKLEKINPTFNEPTPDNYSDKSYKSSETETESDSIATGLNRPPIHDDHTWHRGLHIVNSSSRNKSDLMDSHEESFSHLSESDDSFSYLNQDLKRPPINPEKSPLLNETGKMDEFNNNEEELFHLHHVSRE